MDDSTATKNVPTPQESMKKTVIYRLYATLITTAIALWIFKPEMRHKLGQFFILDIIVGMLTYYSFERVYSIF